MKISKKLLLLAAAGSLLPFNACASYEDVGMGIALGAVGTAAATVLYYQQYVKPVHDKALQKEVLKNNDKQALARALKHAQDEQGVVQEKLVAAMAELEAKARNLSLCERLTVDLKRALTAAQDSLKHIQGALRSNNGQISVEQSEQLLMRASRSIDDIAQRFAASESDDY